MYSVVKPFNTMSPRNSVPDVESFLREIRKDPSKIIECNISARKVREKRRLRILKLQSKESLMNTTLDLSNQERWAKASKARLELEKDDMVKKFLKIHKKRIWDMYVKLVELRAKTITTNEKCLKSLITFIYQRKVMKCLVRRYFVNCVVSV